uniref:CopG family transcriptional regulator n=1 Tax=Heterorhabditis bacteriophora TaxID=37862 RepID=A0A1I7WVG2_HETBA
MSGGNEEAQLAQCQAYVQRHNIQQLVKEAIEHFDKLNEQRTQ